MTFFPFDRIVRSLAFLQYIFAKKELWDENPKHNQHAWDGKNTVYLVTIVSLHILYTIQYSGKNLRKVKELEIRFLTKDRKYL